MNWLALLVEVLTLHRVRLVPLYRVRVIYKSGAVQDADAWVFKVDKSPLSGELHSVTWDYPAKVQPLFMGVNEIAAVWQIGYRWRLRFGNSE